MTTFHPLPRSPEARHSGGLFPRIGAQVAAVLMAVLVASPSHMPRDISSASAPVRGPNLDPRA